jgi:hypothetical protein
MIPMAYARGTLIFEKNMKSKISCQTPINTPSSLRLLILYFGIITFWKSYISKVLGLVMLHLVKNTLCYATVRFVAVPKQNLLKP